MRMYARGEVLTLADLNADFVAVTEGDADAAAAQRGGDGVVISGVIESIFVQTRERHLYHSMVYRGSQGETRLACGACGLDLGLVASLQVGGTCGCGAWVHTIRYALPQDFHRGIIFANATSPPQPWDLSEVDLPRWVLLDGPLIQGSTKDLPVSDRGIDGARPLPEPSWNPWMPLPDAEWSQQNRKINDLLAGRTRA